MPSPLSNQQRKHPATYEHKSWHWVTLPKHKGFPDEKVPAVFLAETQSWHGFCFGGLRTKDLKVWGPLEQKLLVPASVHEALADAHSVLNSINAGRSSAVQHNDEVCYAQRKEWIDWATQEVLPKVTEALKFTTNNVDPETN